MREYVFFFFQCLELNILKRRGEVRLPKNKYLWNSIVHSAASKGCHPTLSEKHPSPAKKVKLLGQKLWLGKVADYILYVVCIWCVSVVNQNMRHFGPCCEWELVIINCLELVSVSHLWPDACACAVDKVVWGELELLLPSSALDPHLAPHLAHLTLLLP